MSLTPDDALLPVIRAALDQTRSAACITTAELDVPGPTIVYVNPAYCAMTGRSAEEVIGASPRIMQGPLTSRAVLDGLRADLEAGRPFVGEAVNYRKDGQPFLISWRIDPVTGADGIVSHYIATQSDITATRRAERQLAAGRSIDRSVATVLRQPADPATNVATVAGDIAGAVTDLVDYGRVVVVGSIRLGTSALPFEAGDPGPIDQELMMAARAATEEPETGVRSGVRGDRHWLAAAVTDRRVGIDGVVVVAELSAPELAFIDQGGLAHAVESGRRALDSLAEYERQRLVAIELQESLLPGHPPDIVGLEIATRYQPGAFASRVGGDWYDVVPVGDRTVVVVVGDMAGSGIRAAADMGRVRLLTRVLLQQGMAVPDVFGFLNRFCAEEELLASALAVSVDVVGRAATVVTAGHLPPVVRGNAGTELVPVEPGPLLGIGSAPRYPEVPLPLGDDSTVVLYTDGLVERPDEVIDIGLDRLALRIAADVGPWAGLGDRLLASRAADQPGDDIALLAFRLAPADGPPPG